VGFEGVGGIGVQAIRCRSPVVGGGVVGLAINLFGLLLLRLRAVVPFTGEDFFMLLFFGRGVLLRPVLSFAIFYRLLAIYMQQWKWQKIFCANT
jgi:hypothetical protein